MLEVLRSPEVLTALFFLALLGLGAAIFADHLQLLAKYRGALKNRVAGGYNLAMKVMVANRAGAVLYFLLIGFNIDNGRAAETLALGYAVTLLVLVLPSGMLLYQQQRQMMAQGINTGVFETQHWPWVIVIAAFVATAFNLLGLTLPLLAGAIYPEWRLTLANTSFLFNTIFTIVNVFYIEHRFAKLIDQDSTEIHGFVSGVMVARIAAFVVVGLGLWVL